MTSKAITTFNQWQWDHWCVWQVHCPSFEWSCEETCWCVWRHQGAPVAPSGTNACPWLWPRGNTTSILACVQVWSNFPVLFLAAFDVLTTTTAYHLPLYQDSMNVCVAIAFRILILILSIRLIVPSVVQCYLVHWLNILSIAWPMLRVQRGFVFNIALNLGLRSSKNFFLFEKKKMSSVTQKSWKNGANLLSTSLPHYMLQYSPSLPSSASHTQLITQQ